MTRFLNTMRLDVLNQYRHGFYIVTVLILSFLFVFVNLLPNSAGVFVPAVLLTNMTLATFVFIAGMVLLEKGQGTLSALAVTPLRPSEYLAAKVTTLTALGVVENLAITGFAHATGLLPSVSWGWILLGSTLAGLLYTLLGFVTVMRYRTINDFLIPMIFVVLFLELPGAVCFGMPEYPWLYAFPTFGVLQLIRAGLEPVSVSHLIYGFVYPMIWVAGAFWLGQGLLRRFVADQLGASS